MEDELAFPCGLGDADATGDWPGTGVELTCPTGLGEVAAPADGAVVVWALPLGETAVLPEVDPVGGGPFVGGELGVSGFALAASSPVRLWPLPPEAIGLAEGPSAAALADVVVPLG